MKKQNGMLKGLKNLKNRVGLNQDLDESQMEEVMVGGQPLKVAKKECEVYVDVGTRSKYFRFFTTAHPFIIEYALLDFLRRKEKQDADTDCEKYHLEFDLSIEVDYRIGGVRGGQ